MKILHFALNPLNQQLWRWFLHRLTVDPYCQEAPSLQSSLEFCLLFTTSSCPSTSSQDDGASVLQPPPQSDLLPPSSLYSDFSVLHSTLPHHSANLTEFISADHHLISPPPQPPSSNPDLLSPSTKSRAPIPPHSTTNTKFSSPDLPPTQASFTDLCDQ